MMTRPDNTRVRFTGESVCARDITRGWVPGHLPHTAAEYMSLLTFCDVEWTGSGGVWTVGQYLGLSASERPVWQCISPHNGATIGVIIPPDARVVKTYSQGAAHE